MCERVWNASLIIHCPGSSEKYVSSSDLVTIKTDTALLYDAVTLFATALADLDMSQVVSMTPLSCSDDTTWEHGNSLINYMKMVQINGLTGRVKFDQNGVRTDFELEIVELKKHGLDKVMTIVLFN